MHEYYLEKNWIRQEEGPNGEEARRQLKYLSAFNPAYFERICAMSWNLNSVPPLPFSTYWLLMMQDKWFNDLFPVKFFTIQKYHQMCHEESIMYSNQASVTLEIPLELTEDEEDVRVRGLDRSANPGSVSSRSSSSLRSRMTWPCGKDGHLIFSILNTFFITPKTQ